MKEIDARIGNTLNLNMEGEEMKISKYVVLI
jgi:hypothetical protein